MSAAPTIRIRSGRSVNDVMMLPARSSSCDGVPSSLSVRKTLLGEI